MARQLTAEDARQSLSAHVEAKGAEIFAKYGPQIGWAQLQAILGDPDCVRYPCRLEFDAAPLQPGEIAHPEPLGGRPEDGYTLHIHPAYQAQLEMVPYIALYQLVLVNYGVFASAEDAEIFASTALGLDRELYYQALCRLADQVASAEAPTPGCDLGGGCSCGH